MIKRRYKIILFIIIITIFIYIFIYSIGKKYMKRLDEFIISNNKLIIKNELNNFILKLDNINYQDMYFFNYNNNHEIVGVSFNNENINKYLKGYIADFKENISDILYSKYLSKYYKKIVTKNKTYLLVPMGIISDNPFLYNIGPNIIMSYDLINSFNFNIEFDCRNYGLNNVLTTIYLKVSVDQNIIKPTLKRVVNKEYRFLLSSQMVYGRVSAFLTSGISEQSENL